MQWVVGHYIKQRVNKKNNNNKVYNGLNKISKPTRRELIVFVKIPQNHIHPNSLNKRRLSVIPFYRRNVRAGLSPRTMFITFIHISTKPFSWRNLPSGTHFPFQAELDKFDADLAKQEGHFLQPFHSRHTNNLFLQGYRRDKVAFSFCSNKSDQTNSTVDLVDIRMRPTFDSICSA